MEFTGATKSTHLQTRAGKEEDDVWLDMHYDTWKWEAPSPIDFYIHQQVSEGTSPNLSIYNLRQGETGRLVPKEDGQQKSLKWVSNNAQHTFHSWTKPESVTMVSLNHGNDIRIYEGSLKELINENGPTKPLTGIEAGECLTVRLVLQDEKVSGFYVYIRDWNTAEPGTASDKPYPGI